MPGPILPYDSTPPGPGGRPGLKSLAIGVFVIVTVGAGGVVVYLPDMIGRTETSIRPAECFCAVWLAVIFAALWGIAEGLEGWRGRSRDRLFAIAGLILNGAVVTALVILLLVVVAHWL